MGKASRKKGPVKARTRKSGSMAFGLVITVISVIGVTGIALSRGGDDAANEPGPAVGEHWHAAMGVNICGTWQPNFPETQSAAGVHSHGEGFMHIHPHGAAGAHRNATVGKFYESGGAKVSATELKMFGQDYKNGEKCKVLDNKPGEVRWSVNGNEKSGDPAEYIPNDGDVIALAFLPKGEEIGVPPVAASGASPANDGGPSPVPVTPETTPPATTTPDSSAPPTTTSGK